MIKLIGKFKLQDNDKLILKILKKFRIKIGGNMNPLKIITENALKSDLPIFNVGDTVKVGVNIIEGEKKRIQYFEGVVIARNKNNDSISETFTVRKISHGVGVERVFPLHSPNVVGVEVISKGSVRRAKLYYLRDRVGKAAKIKTKRDVKTASNL